MTRLRRFLALSPHERRLLVHAAILLAVVGTSLAFFGYLRTAMWLAALTRALPSRPDSTVRLSHAGVVEFAVATAARCGLVRASNLPRGLVVWALLCRNGVDATLKFGMRRRLGQFEVHTWVETRHARIGTPQPVAFVPLATPLS